MTMTQSNQASQPRPLRLILLLLTLITSPLICCGAIQLLNALPASLLPPALDFSINLFDGEARIENRTVETFYLTPITTTYGQPMIITQNIAFRQRAIPLEPDGFVVLHYDSADMPLAGIAACRTDEDCRLLAVDNSGKYVLEAYEELPSLELSWLQAIQSRPVHNYSNILLPALCLVPILLFATWLYLGRLEKKRAS